jgi:hypothetical protein
MLHGTTEHPVPGSLAGLRPLVLTRASGPDNSGDYSFRSRVNSGCFTEPLNILFPVPWRASARWC